MVNVQMTERTENIADEAAVDDIEEWSDASDGEDTSVNEEREDSLSRPVECPSEEPTEAANQQSLLHAIVAAIAPLDKKMDLVRQEVSNMKTVIRSEFQEELQKIQNQIDATNDRMDRIDQLLLNQHQQQHDEPATLSAEATPFVPIEIPVQMGTHQPVKYQQKVPRYDGIAVWEAYFAQFSILSEEHSWSDEEKAFFLSTSLDGKALTVLANMPASDRKVFLKLVDALEGRFGARHQQQQSRMLLGTSKRRDEPLQEFVESLKRRVMLAYPNASSDIQDTLALHHLTTAVDAQARSEILRQKPRTLQEALEVVATEDAIRACCSGSNRTVTGAPVRAVQADTAMLSERRGTEASESDVSVLAGVVSEVKGILQLLKHNVPQDMGQTSPRSYRFNGSCWYCQKQGHLKRDCRKWQSDVKKGVQPRHSEPERAEN